MKDKGFTLIELLIVFALLAILAIVVLTAINPVEQLRKARDAARKVSANELLRAIERFQVNEGRNPNINPTVAFLTCSEIVVGEPVSDLADLGNELSSWFPQRINQPENQLHVGLLSRSGLAKICYQVEAVTNITRVQESGCFQDFRFFLCLPE